MPNENFSFESPNPYQSNLVQENLSLVFQGKEEIQMVEGVDEVDVYRDVKTGEKFYEIAKDEVEGRRQVLLAMVAKGIINISDVVEKDGKFYSHQQKSESLAVGHVDPKIAVAADTFLLYRVFGDPNHDMHSDYDVAKAKRDNPEAGKVADDDGWVRHDNMLVDPKRKTVNYFDVEYAALDKPAVYKEWVIDDWQEDFEDSRQFNPEEYKDIAEYKSFLSVVADKVDRFRTEIFSPDKFSVFHAMAVRSKLYEDEKDEKKIFEYISEQLEKLETVIKTKIKTMPNR